MASGTAIVAAAAARNSVLPSRRPMFFAMS